MHRRITSTNQTLSFNEHLELEIGKHPDRCPAACLPATIMRAAEGQKAGKDRAQVAAILELEEEEMPQ